jgi:hypothetical protein
MLVQSSCHRFHSIRTEPGRKQGCPGFHPGGLPLSLGVIVIVIRTPATAALVQVEPLPVLPQGSVTSGRAHPCLGVSVQIAAASAYNGITSGRSRIPAGARVEHRAAAHPADGQEAEQAPALESQAWSGGRLGQHCCRSPPGLLHRPAPGRRSWSVNSVTVRSAGFFSTCAMASVRCCRMPFRPLLFRRQSAKSPGAAVGTL